MILTELKIHCLRNIQSAHLRLNSRFNFITGPNGSGKTSILEACYLLSCGHSFRTRENSPIITHQQPSLTIYAKGQQEESISIQKSAAGPTQIKLNNQFCSTTSQLAYALPCQIFSADIFQIIEAGSSVRRNLLDWGLFHVKHDYLSIWKEYKRVLKQRNALLKTNAPYAQFAPWDKQLSQFAQLLHCLREEYFIEWEKAFTEVLSELSELDCTLSYSKGWDKKNTGKELEEILIESFESDKHRTYTQYGAHQADFLIEIACNKAKNILSRGQQKIILLSLKLAQAKLVNSTCLHLIDDLPAELDEEHQKRVINYLSKIKDQCIITSNISIDSLSASVAEDYYSLFFIKEGKLSLTR